MVLERFREYIGKRALITDDEFDQLVENSTVKVLKRQEFLLREGELYKYYAFVTRGS